MLKSLPSYNDKLSSSQSRTDASSVTGSIDASLKSGFSGSIISDGSVSNIPSLSSRGHGVARWEQKLVAWSKVLVFIVLLLATASAAFATQHFVAQEERKDFEDQFRAYASEIVAVARQRTDQLFSTLDKFSVSIASEAVNQHMENNQTWPFVTINHWSLKATKFQEVIAAESPALLLSPIVHEDQKQEWAAYVAQNAPSWYQQSSDNEERNYNASDLMKMTLPFVHFYDPNNGFMPTPVSRPGDVLPVWQSFPFKTDPINPLLGTNYDLLTGARISDLFEVTKATRGATIGITQTRPSANTTVAESQIMQPVFRGVDTGADDREMVGVLWLRMEWKDYFQNLLVEGADGITVVLASSCPKVDALSGTTLEEVGVLSFEINGPEAKFLGEIDAHDSAYDDLQIAQELVDLEFDQSVIPEGKCVPTLTMHLYPSKGFEETFHTSKRFIYMAVVILIFVFTSSVFFLYDYFVARRQRKVMERIVKQDKIVSNVFPTAIRDRLYNAKDEEDGLLAKDDGYDSDGLFDPNFGSSPNKIGGSSPLADLFPNTTVVFADISGFTAWASAREPQQVFTLLESIYGCFDKITYRHNVFKVETVGDCYVAVSGLPDPCKDHAVSVVRFARDCLKKMKEITLKLEVTLGPDTADLTLRVGIHSGQVTAGVLRGERSRFQLFGDTMNTAARMESTSKNGKIQLSQATADLLVAGGYGNMILPREERIQVKGKGEMQTYWLRMPTKKRKPTKKRSTNMLSSLDETAESTESSDDLSNSDLNSIDVDGVEGMTKTQRLVEWNVEVLTGLLQQIIASRQGSSGFDSSLGDVEKSFCKSETVLEEFVPIISLKRFHTKEMAFRRRSATSLDIGEDAKSELRKYLTNIASMYTDSNSFHNFEHASHVTSSVKKLLKRIVNVEGNGLGSNPSDELKLVDLAGHSYGITSDPLTQFAVVFSAVIHDVDHPGVPNAQLVKENTRNAKIYGKSIAEQNSVDLAWEMLMSDDYKHLRSCIYQTEDDLRRFRQLVVNTVLATDIVDKELQTLRKNRWQVAFSESEAQDEQSEDRKATIVIEHLIQASDVSHTMQHWHLYKKWNERFFTECYGAYKAGRADTDPSINWYKGEIGFFDFYVIPLAKKLDNCGVFGVSSDEYLNYAKANREEWVREGEKLVQQFLANYNSKSE